MATWTVNGIGSNSTGSFTLPANTGTTDKSYTVTYDDGNGNTATTSVTVSACSRTRNIIICSTGTTSENKLVLHLAAQDHRIPIGTSIKCLFDVVYIHRTDDSSGHTLVELTLEGGSTYDEVVTEVSLDTYIVKSYCYASKGVDSDDTYYYVYLPDC